MALKLVLVFGGSIAVLIGGSILTLLANTHAVGNPPVSASMTATASPEAIADNQEAMAELP